MKTTVITSLFALTSTALAACSRQGSVELTFYGFPDNDPPSAQTAYDCGGRNYVAGGTGTFDNPLSMASAQGEFSQCEIVYVPYLKKYVRCKLLSTSWLDLFVLQRDAENIVVDEDFCAQCTSDFKNGKRHIDIWTGSPTVSGGQEQIDCEDSLTPSGDIVIVRKPANNYAVGTTPLYHKVCSSSNLCFRRE